MIGLSAVKDAQLVKFQSMAYIDIRTMANI